MITNFLKGFGKKSSSNRHAPVTNFRRGNLIEDAPNRHTRRAKIAWDRGEPMREMKMRMSEAHDARKKKNQERIQKRHADNHRRALKRRSDAKKAKQIQ